MTATTVRTDSTEVTATHLLPGEGYTWVEATKVDAPWSDEPYAWEFKNGADCVRWLRSEIE